MAGVGMSRLSRSFWLDRPTFVTGATGLLGGWVVRRLLDLGADVYALVRDWRPKSELVSSRLTAEVTLVRGDVGDQALLERILNEREVETVVHLAAQTTVPVAGRNPASTFATNVGGTWALLEACRRSPTVRQVVAASSDKAYGSAGREKYREEMPLRATNPYDVSKACADMIARSYATAFGLPVAVTRCGNFFGGGDLNWNRVVPGTIRSAIRGHQPKIRSDGTPVRDYLYVEDGVEATLLLAERLAQDGSLAGEVFNFAAERPLPVLELVGKILEMMECDLEPRILGEGDGEISYQALSAEKARNTLGWQSVFSLEEGLERTIDWYQSFFAQGELK